MTSKFEETKRKYAGLIAGRLGMEIEDMLGASSKKMGVGVQLPDSPHC